MSNDRLRMTIIMTETSVAARSTLSTSLRDWFAGQALAAYANVAGGNRDQTVVEKAYRMADAMLRARSEEK